MSNETHTVTEAALRVAREVLETEAKALAKVAREFDAAAFTAALEILLQRRGRIVCTGMGKSGIIAKKIAGTLASTGSPAFFLHPAEAGHGDLGMIVDGDVVIALSHSGETAEVVALLPSVRRMDVGWISLVGDADSTMAQEADVVLHAGIDAEACPLGLAPTASTTAALALGDALAMALLQARGFSSEDFANIHPRGSLGRKLVRVGNVMHAGASVPRVDAGSRLQDAVREMSAKGLGMTVVEDSDGVLRGIVTDGDLRRLIERGVDLSTPVVECMTAAPQTVPESALAPEALRVMEDKKITALVVVDPSGRASGVVHLHALWRTQMI